MNIKEIILNEIKDKDWSKLEIARYIYIRLGELLVFNPLYLCGSTGTKNRLFYEGIDVENLKDNKVVCSGWAKIYKELLEAVDITAMIAGNAHNYVLVSIDRTVIEADATAGSYSDLTRIKYGDELELFGDNSFEEIDTYLSYKKGMYLKEALLMLKKDMKNPDSLKETLGITENMRMDEIVKRKFEFIISLVNRTTDETKGYIDVINYLYNLMDVLLDVEEVACIEENVYYSIEDMNCDNVVVFRILVEDEKIYYCYSKKEDGIYKIEKIEEENVLPYEKSYHTKGKNFYI